LAPANLTFFEAWLLKHIAEVIPQLVPWIERSQAERTLDEFQD
jgi:hypothetical protein